MRSSLRRIAEASLLVTLCATSVRGQYLPPVGDDAWTSPSSTSPPSLWAEHSDQIALAVDRVPVTSETRARGTVSGVGLTAGEMHSINALGSGNSTCCAGMCDYSPACDACPTRGLIAFLGYDSWRGISDDGWGNNGIHTGLNFGSQLGAFSDWTGIGMQVGGSVAAANWAGTDYRLSRQDEGQTQGFITYGLFRNANERSRWSAAVAHDWMLNSNYGVFAENPNMAQWRAQAGYAFSASNEVGIWGTLRMQEDTRDVIVFGPTTWRPINQINTYVHHKWQAGGPDTWLWLGLPEKNRLNGDGSLGDFLVGALANCPFNDSVALYSMVSYMHQSASAGPAGASEDAWNFTIGLSFYPSHNARSQTVAGQCWMPQLPVANNGTFLVDVSQTY